MSERQLMVRKCWARAALRRAVATGQRLQLVQGQRLQLDQLRMYKIGLYISKNWEDNLNTYRLCQLAPGTHFSKPSEPEQESKVKRARLSYVRLNTFALGGGRRH